MAIRVSYIVEHYFTLPDFIDSEDVIYYDVYNPPHRNSIKKYFICGHNFSKQFLNYMLKTIFDKNKI